MCKFGKSIFRICFFFNFSDFGVPGGYISEAIEFDQESMLMS